MDDNMDDLGFSCKLFFVTIPKHQVIVFQLFTILYAKNRLAGHMQFTLHVSEFVPQAITLDESLCSVEKGWKCLSFEKYSLPTHIFQVFKAPTACRFLVINNIWHPRYGLLLTSDQINLGLSENSILPTWVYIHLPKLRYCCVVLLLFRFLG